MRIGVISDTHGRLDSQVLEEFRSVARILHAGDVGSEEVLLELSAVAQVIAVRGNVDGFPLTTRLREAEVVELAGVRLLI
ncbi:MAG TPA: metallophosphoesterase family protein, partial [Candidatus Polarisedimenticolia bacterium]|nr:metallophosphoesterase family protein [Candidatus Polarisedimenticolia bacterium]